MWLPAESNAGCGSEAEDCSPNAGPITSSLPAPRRLPAALSSHLLHGKVEPPVVALCGWPSILYQDNLWRGGEGKREDSRSSSRSPEVAQCRQVGHVQYQDNLWRGEGEGVGLR